MNILQEYRCVWGEFRFRTGRVSDFAKAMEIKKKKKGCDQKRPTRFL